ncbi:MAG TPA: NAD-dependent epimerase/dehydratase family protein [Prolixibacteraceae bacterium]|nr:NAD-dependent epimerase/dehydratase family protein [Prolixibacteraceae bacterium]
MKQIALVGASGFIGTRLIELIGKENCYNIDKNPSEKYNDITTIQDIREKNLENALPVSTDTVILLAAEHRDDVSPISLYYDVNVNGTRHVLDAMDKQGIYSIIFISSAAVYGLNNKNPDEQFPPDPFSHYGKSKWQAEKVLREWQLKDPENKSLTIIRPSVAFGEKNQGNVHNLLRQIASGRFLMIGRGENRKSMAYVGNVAAFIKFCIGTNKPGLSVLNYTDQPDLTMNELVLQAEESLNRKLPSLRLPYWIGMSGGFIFDLMARITGRKFPISSIRIKKFCATTQIDASKAHSSGFKAPFTYAEGLDRTLKSEFGEKISRNGSIN